MKIGQNEQELQKIWKNPTNLRKIRKLEKRNQIIKLTKKEKKNQFSSMQEGNENRFPHRIRIENFISKYAFPLL